MNQVVLIEEMQKKIKQRSS